MIYSRKPETIEAIMFDGSNLEQIRQFLKDYFKYGRIMEDGHLFLMLNSNNALYRAQVYDYIIIDKTHSFTMTKQSFENIYIPQS